MGFVERRVQGRVRDRGLKEGVPEGRRVRLPPRHVREHVARVASLLGAGDRRPRPREAHEERDRQQIPRSEL